MSRSPSYFSIRWRIITIACLVLGVTCIGFIFQQRQLQLHTFELNQARLAERNQDVLKHLIQLQADRMQLLANLLVEQPQVREDLLIQRSDRLLKTVETMAAELSLGQGISTVLFQDNEQHWLTRWGDTVEPDATLSRQTATQERPHSRIECGNSCLYYTAFPVSYQGKTIGTITLISNLEFFLNDLHQLTNADVAVLYGHLQQSSKPLDGMRIVSVSGGLPIRSVLEAALTGAWFNGVFQFAQAGLVHQVSLATSPEISGGKVNFALVSDVTSQLQLIDYEVNNNVVRGILILILATALLYVMLRPIMRRIQYIGQLLPLLGAEKFDEVRVSYEQRPRACVLGKYWDDELENLARLAWALSGRLEILRDNARQHNRLLTEQAGQLRHERDFINGLLETAPVLIVHYDDQGQVQLINAYALKICGLHSLSNQRFGDLCLGGETEILSLELAKMRVGMLRSSESRISRASGKVSDVLWYHTRLADGENGEVNFLSVGMDITELKRTEAQMHNLAFYDSLTKLPNRRMLLDCIQHAKAASLRKHTHCALIFINLDQFRSINDNQGQEIGDRFLVEIAARLRVNVREFDTVSRLGADEFVVLLEELSEDLAHAASQVGQVAEKLREAINLPYHLQNQTCQLSCSFGISLFAGEDIAVDDLLWHANLAMSHAKASGRNVVRFFDLKMQISIEERAACEADLRAALLIPQEHFQLFYQMQVNAKGQALGAEALLRWMHPTRGRVSPLDFIPLAEETGLIVPLGTWVLDSACAQLKAWENEVLTRDLQLAVNVSALQFHQADFATEVLRILAKHRVNPARLKLELTESLVVKNIDDAISKMTQLKAHGVRFSIDDFGTAYSSLSYLTQLPLDQLKIDQSFVRNLTVKHTDAVVVQIIINLAQAMGMEVIAEGVETLAQCEFLAQIGCLNYQGYWFSKPLPLEAFTLYLEARAGL